MSLFVDTSALVKYYYPEKDSEQFEEAILRVDRVYLCELSPVEFASALMKKIRMGDLRDEDKSLIWDAFISDLQAESVELVSLSEDDYFNASELILKYGGEKNLRTLDSLQLVAALKVPDSSFLAADQNLINAAKIIGLRLAEV